MSHDVLLLIENEKPLSAILLAAASRLLLCLLHRQRDVVLVGNAAEVEDCVAHTSEGGVDAHTCRVGALLEAHVEIVAHLKHFALQFRQRLHKHFHVGENLMADD